MILILIAAVVLTVGILVFRFIDDDYYVTESLVCFTISTIAGAVLISALLLIPIKMGTDRNCIVEYNVTKQVLAEYRADATKDIERAALSQKVIAVNSWIATAKYWNGTTWGIYWLDEAAELEPLK